MEEKSLRDEIQELKDIVRTTALPKQRKFKLPYKAKLNKSKLKQGYITIGIINENKTVDFVKEPVIDGTIKLGDTYHAVADFDVYNYKGKPFIFQAKSKLNPYNPLDGQHETYGQKYVMARMEGDRITAKKKIGWGLSIGLIVVVIIIIYFLMKG